MPTPYRRNLVTSLLTIAALLICLSLWARYRTSQTAEPMRLEWRMSPSFYWFQDYRYTVDFYGPKYAHYQATLKTTQETRRKQGELSKGQMEELLKGLAALPLDNVAGGYQEKNMPTDQPNYSIRYTTSKGTIEDQCYGLPSKNRRAVHSGLRELHPGQILQEWEKTGR